MPLDQGAQAPRKPVRHGTQTTTTPVVTRGVGGWAHSYQHLWWAPGLSAHSGGAPRATRAHDTTPMDPSRKRPLEDISPDKGSADDMQKAPGTGLSPCLPPSFRRFSARLPRNSSDQAARGTHSSITTEKRPQLESGPSTAQHSTAQQHAAPQQQQRR